MSCEDCNTVKKCKAQSMMPMTEGEHPVSVRLVPGYGELLEILIDALQQAQCGKGSARHGSSKPFSEQPMMRISEQFGDGFPLGQAFKKLEESMRLDKDSAIRERLGAINYIAGSILLMQREEMGTSGGVTLTDDDFRPITNEKYRHWREMLKKINEDIPFAAKETPRWNAYCSACNTSRGSAVIPYDAVGVRMMGDKCMKCKVTGFINYMPYGKDKS